ncbi:MAG: AAA family ATPase [Myxococcota bacterium]|nr:AAA family ATPase [Myxococcota bacterium]
MGLKLAISGKGGVGKTTVAALLARSFAARGRRVVAIDADPVPNLAAALGIPPDVRAEPIAAMRELIAERTGAAPGTFGGLFKMNPTVDDIPERFAVERDGVRLLVMGTVDRGGKGCVCPESVLLRALVQHLLLGRDDVVVMDMEAGVEHLGRATASAVDRLLIVVDPGTRSREAARAIRKLAADIGLRAALVANRVRDEEDLRRIREALPDLDVIGSLPADERILTADREGTRPYEDLSTAPAALAALVGALDAPA